MKGNAPLDTLHILSLAVPNIVFHDIEDIGGGLFSMLDHYDGSIGLGPPNAASNTCYNDTTDKAEALALPNILYQLFDHAIMPLRNNTMIIRFPPSKATQGRLTIGESPLTDLSFSLPMQKCNPYYGKCDDTWDVHLEEIRLLGDHPIDIPLQFYTSITVESLPVTLSIALPTKTASYIWGYLQARPDPGNTVAGIECSRRHTLPDIVVVFFGHEMVLGWEDYTMQVEYDDGQEPDCFVTIVAVENG
ncbi:putative aspartic peptidase domain superfamily, Peptidase family A1 domain-containing protein [Septoria linicola]|nr:putative aspartic peptidase domain superfamily, Peptidase family A1 domain-containing protein [Septoria linicola]